jgi:hypothetical protein
MYFEHFCRAETGGFRRADRLLRLLWGGAGDWDGGDVSGLRGQSGGLRQRGVRYRRAVGTRRLPVLHLPLRHSRLRIIKPLNRILFLLNSNHATRSPKK